VGDKVFTGVLDAGAGAGVGISLPVTIELGRFAPPVKKGFAASPAGEFRGVI